MQNSNNKQTAIVPFTEDEVKKVGFEAFRAGFDLAKTLQRNAMKKAKSVNQPTTTKKSV